MIQDYYKHMAQRIDFDANFSREKNKLISAVATAETALIDAQTGVETAQGKVLRCEAVYNEGREKHQWTELLKAREELDQSQVIVRQAKIKLDIARDALNGWQPRKAKELLPLARGALSQHMLVQQLEPEIRELAAIDARLLEIQSRIESVLRERSKCLEHAQQLFNWAMEPQPQVHNPTSTEFMHTILSHSRRLRGQFENIITVAYNRNIPTQPELQQVLLGVIQPPPVQNVVRMPNIQPSSHKRV